MTLHLYILCKTFVSDSLLGKDSFQQTVILTVHSHNEDRSIVVDKPRIIAAIITATVVNSTRRLLLR